MKNGVFWDGTPCGCCRNRRIGGTYRLLHQGDKNRRARNNISGNYKVIRSSETSVATIVTRRRITEDGILLEHRTLPLNIVPGIVIE
jgi:hypothetical protein